MTLKEMYYSQIKRFQEIEYRVCQVIREKNLNITPNQIYEFCKYSEFSIFEVISHLEKTGMLPFKEEI